MKNLPLYLTRSALVDGLATLLLACGGGGGGGSTPTTPPIADGGLDDTNVYSSQPGAALSGAVEASAVTQHSITLDGQPLNYTATAGHLIARELAGAQRAQASMFYVAYTVAGAATTRPVTFFYNGGPGSASVWLLLGSYGPKRLVTGVPNTTLGQPFQLVDNTDSLLAQSDLVFVNAVGSGRSQAILPFSNISFWGVDKDAELFRDFVIRYLQANNRTTSPKFLFGESYGGPRTAVLARRLHDAGVLMDGLVLQAPAMDYNSNCGVSASPKNSCAGYFPSYAAVAAFHGRSNPVPSNPEAFAAQAVQFTDSSYAPAVQNFLNTGTVASGLLTDLANYSGLTTTSWQNQFNKGPDAFRNQLLTGQIIGRYDGRMKAPLNSALAAEGDPSNTWVSSSFYTVNNSYLRDTLRYRNNSTYVMLSNAIQYWDFRHEGLELPDTIPDLGVALGQNPRMRVLAINGYHDLATPYHVTENDLARLGNGRVKVRNYAGGHMTYLDDGSRPAQRADLISFYADAIAARAPASAMMRRAPAAPVVAVDRAGTVQTPGSVPQTFEPAFQSPMRGPWVPPR